MRLTVLAVAHTRHAVDCVRRSKPSSCGFVSSVWGALMEMPLFET